MGEDIIARARGCLLGLAVGDALGGPTEGKSPQEISRIWGRVTDFLDENQAGSDDTEFALFNARLLLLHGPRISAVAIAEGWKNEIVSVSNTYRGAGFSEMLAIRSLKAGLLPPRSGQHCHSWSDGLAMRVPPFGIVTAGQPDAAARLAEMDGSVTHEGEGIFAGQAVAAAVSCGMGGGTIWDVVDAARGVIPAGSWTKRAIDRAVDIGAKSADVWTALGPLYEAIVCPSYFWSDVAPEAVALAFGILVASRGRFRDAILGGVNVGRDTDTIAAIAGSIVGASRGISAIPPEWTRNVLPSKGRCLHVVKGMNVEETADKLVALAGRWTV